MDIIVPEFPAPVEGVKGNKYPKLSTEQLTGYYDLLTAAGCLVVPKRREDKIPLGAWKQYRPETYTQALSDQEREDVSGWCVITGYGRVFVIDLDVKAIQDGGNEAEAVYANLQALSPTAFVLATPSNGVHLYYLIPEGLELLTNSHTPGIAGVDARGVGGQVVSLGGFNHYENTEDKPNYCETKGVPNGHTSDYGMLDDGDYSRIVRTADKGQTRCKG